MSLATPLLIYSLSAGADLGSTEVALARNPYAREWNPLLRNPHARIARGIVGIGIATGFDVLLQKRAPRWRWVPRVIIPAVSVGIAVHNLQQR